MKRKLFFTILAVMTIQMAYYAKTQELNTNQQKTQSYNLDEHKVQSYQLKSNTSTVDEVQETNDNEDSKITPPKIVTEEIPGGRIEKLVDDKGNVIAEKTIQNNKITQKILNYYYPDNKLMRRITNKGNNSGFYAEEYYSNGKISSQAMYLNENNKIGTEKKYDIYGTLRQEIPWVLIQNQTSSGNTQKTIRQGEVITYYPQGQVAAKFAVGKPGTTVFYSQQGAVLKEIKNAQILNYTKELTEEDCEGMKVHLGLDDLIELYEDEGDISYNKCGFPYRENFIYEVYNKNSNALTKISFDETGMIRRITPYINGKKNGTEKKYDASGNLIAEVNYEKGIKQGDANGYFPTGEKAFHKHYEKDKVEGVMNCYFPDGKIAATFPYKDGLKEGTAIVNSPVKKEIKFSQGKILDQAPQQPRHLVSVLPNIKQIDSSCRDLSSKLMKLLLNIETTEYNIKSTFNLTVPKGCEDIKTFKMEGTNLVCHTDNQEYKAVIPYGYNRGEYAVENIYSKDNKLVYEIPYINQKRQGLARKYDNEQHIIIEANYNKGELTETSRNYYQTGQIKEMITDATNAKRSLIIRYDQDGHILFSLTYKDKNKQEAYIREGQQETFIRFYNGKPDVIRESNQQTPQNFIEYNLALGEYIRYENNQPISGGKICQQIPTNKMEVIDMPQGESIISNKAVTINKEKEYKLENAVIPSEKEKHQAQLAAQNIGPIQKPGIEQLSDVVQKEKIKTPFNHMENNAEPKTEKFYYPNGNLRKTIKTRGPRTEEIKEYSKTGLMLTDTVYNKDKIVIEKYFGSGEVRRKTEKSYTDNSVMAFLHREDFFDNGKPRYEITRKPETLLFSEKRYNSDGSLKSETEQRSPLSFITKEYNSEGSLAKEVYEEGGNNLIKEYDNSKQVQKLTFNNKDMPVSLAENGDKLLKDNTKTHNTKGGLVTTLKTEKNNNELIEYYNNGKVKTEIIFYADGEISVKGFSEKGNLEKYAHLSIDGKLHIEKPELRVIPSYRERHWVDYNNPKWIENQDRYSIKLIAKLNLDMASYILKELGMNTPNIIKQMYEKY